MPRSREELGRIVSRAAAQAEATKKQLQQTAARAVAIISRAGLTAADFSGKSRSFANYFFTVAAGELKPYGATVAKMAAAPEGWGAKAHRPRRRWPPSCNPCCAKCATSTTPTARAWNTCDLLKRELPQLRPAVGPLQARVQQLCDEQNMMLLSETKYVLSEFIGHNDAPFIYEKVGNRFERFMIDEFQDTSLKEWENFLPLLQNAMAQSRGDLGADRGRHQAVDLPLAGRRLENPPRRGPAGAGRGRHPSRGRCGRTGGASPRWSPSTTASSNGSSPRTTVR